MFNIESLLKVIAGHPRLVDYRPNARGNYAVDAIPFAVVDQQGFLFQDPKSIGICDFNDSKVAEKLYSTFNQAWELGREITNTF